MNRHIDKYVRRIYHLHDLPDEDYYHIEDQISESYVSLIHSILLASIGLVSDAITTLRRSFETTLYGSFFATTSLIIEREKYNPFVQFLAKNNNFRTKPVRFNDLKQIISIVSDQKSITKNEAIKDILINFSYYFLSYLCKPKCKIHYDEKKHPICSLGSEVNWKCTDCQNSTNKMLVERTVIQDLMIRILSAKLDSNSYKFDLVNLNAELSAYVHPSYRTHQHEPRFNNKELSKWLSYLKQMINTIVWIYMKTLRNIGIEENETNSLMESKGYDLIL